MRAQETKDEAIAATRRPTLEAVTRAAARRLPNVDTPLLDARVIIRHALGLDEAAFIAGAHRPLSADELRAIDALIERRAGGEPVAYIVGEKEFYGLKFDTAPGVLCPRPDSETLIEAARRRRPSNAPLTILDLGTGTGCLLCALLASFDRASGVGVDVNIDAALLAARNARSLGLAERAHFLGGEWAAPLAGRFDLVVSNPPYIAANAPLPRDVLEFEDPRALFGGPDGFDGVRSVLAAAQASAAPGALNIIEIGAEQAASAAALAAVAFPGALVEFERDLAGRRRALAIDLGPQKNI